MIIGKERKMVHFEDVTPGAVFSEGILGHRDYARYFYIKLMPEDEEFAQGYNAVNLEGGSRASFAASAEVEVYPDARRLLG